MRITYFQIAMDDGRRPRVQEVEAFEDLSTPRLEYFEVDLLETPQIPAGRETTKTADKPNSQAPDYHSAAQIFRSTEKQPPADVTHISHVRRRMQISYAAAPARWQHWALQINLN
jgi:hypothetical protein